MNSIYRNLIYTIATLLISCVAVYLYTISVVGGLDYYNKYDLRDGLLVSTIELLVYLGLSTYFLQKILQKKWRILLSTFLYLVMLQELFFNLVFSLRAEFGTTWTTMEIRFVLVLYYKKTIILLSVSTIIYYFLLRFSKNKNMIEKA